MGHRGVGCRGQQSCALTCRGRRDFGEGTGDFGEGKGLEAAVWGWGRGQTPLPSPGPTSCAFLGPGIPFQMDNSFVNGEKSPLVRIRNGAFGD